MAFLDINGRSVGYRLLGGEALPLLVMAHPLGMSQAVWDDLLPLLLRRYRILTWDLPGHGCSAPWLAQAGGLVAEKLADDVLTLATHAGVDAFHFVGTSIGGTIGQQLLLQAPGRLLSAILTNTGAVIGTHESWSERASSVRADGLAVLAADIVARWFGADALAAQPALAAGWQTQLARTDAESYALLCEMLGQTDFRDQLGHSDVPVTLFGGSADVAVPSATLEVLAHECGDVPLQMLDGIGHVPSVECPALFGERLLEVLDRREVVAANGASYADGLTIRQQVLGADHVARASANATTLDEPFQQMITRLAWGELWGNADLTRSERSMITLAVLAALGRDGELELHLKTAQRIGLSEAQLRQALMHVAVYAGVPAANHAFAMAKKVGWGEALQADQQD